MAAVLLIKPVFLFLRKFSIIQQFHLTEITLDKFFPYKKYLFAIPLHLKTVLKLTFNYIIIPNRTAVDYHKRFIP